jgi:mono/diheme cytochrome c family protein
MTMTRAAGNELPAALAGPSVAALAVNTLPLLRSHVEVNADAGMRILSVIAASLAIIWPWLSAASFAQQSTPAGAANPLPQAEASPDDIEGGKMFATTCGFCHQDGGRHAGRGPKLSKSERSDEYIVERIKKGKMGAMPAYGSVFSDGQIIAILAYIRGLDD